jgi:hypothetical protein
LIDGRIDRKSLAALREMAIVVHDDRFRPKDSNLPPRWRDSEHRWTPSGEAYYYAGDFQPLSTANGKPRWAWLTYHHWRCSPVPGLRTKESPILDDDGYNLGPPRRLNPVSDVLLRCRVRTAGDGWLAASLHDGREFFEIHFRPCRGEATLWREGRQVASGGFPRRGDDVAWRLEAALCDQQVLAAIDDRQVFAWNYDKADRPSAPAPRPLALGTAGLAAEVSELMVLRDVYYLPPRGQAAWTLSEPLDQRGYLVLGDNAAISQDSRTWLRPAISRDQLRGRVLHGPFHR